MAPMLPSLPFDVIEEEILHKAPADSLMRFRTTCKDWDALITSKGFVYKRLDHTPELFFRIDNGDNIQIMDPQVTLFTDSPITEEFRFPYPIKYLIHCDGVFLCLRDDMHHERLKDFRLAVWNPLLRKIKWIRGSLPYNLRDFFGFGYAHTSRENYKILRFLDVDGRMDDEESEPDQMYEFKTGSWRPLKIKCDWNIDINCKGISVKGNMYYMATTKKERSVILSFDFSTEKFKQICDCPDPHQSTQKIASFHGDKLSFLQQDDVSREIEVYVTNMLSDGSVRLTKHSSVRRRDLPSLYQPQYEMAHPFYSIRKDNKIMAWCEDVQVEEDERWSACIRFYEIHDRGVKTVVTGLHDTISYLDPLFAGYLYVPSLIPVPE